MLHSPPACAVPAELRQLGADHIHASRAGIGVQQAIDTQGADFMAFLCGFRDGPVDGQGFRIILLQDGVKGVHLLHSGL